jgi:hypothetical protein
MRALALQPKTPSTLSRFSFLVVLQLVLCLEGCSNGVPRAILFSQCVNDWSLLGASAVGLLLGIR